MYLPIVPPPRPSPEAQELSGHLVDVINAYQTDHPHMSPLEVRQAVRLAQQAAPVGGKLAIRGVAAALLVAGFAVLFGVRAAAEPGSMSLRSVMWVIPAVGILAIVVAARTMRKR